MSGRKPMTLLAINLGWKGEVDRKRAWYLPVSFPTGKSTLFRFLCVWGYIKWH